MNPRPYQTEAIDAVLAEWDRGSSATLIVLATGLGKTIIAAMLAQHARNRTGKKVLFLAHRQELLDQAKDKIEQATSLLAEVEMADRHVDRDEFYDRVDVVCASIQSLVAKRGYGKRMEKFDPDEFGMVIVDEAHRTTARSYMQVLDYFKSAFRVGLTATPDRTDGKALRRVYESVAYRMDIQTAVSEGWLCPVRISRVVLEGVDFSGLKVRAGDFIDKDIERVLDAEKTYHNIAHQLVNKYSQGRRTLVFSPTVSHAEKMAEVLERYEPGRVAVVTGETETSVRRRAMRDFECGKLLYLVNVAVLCEGVDVPAASVVAMLRPTQSRSLYVQCVGRVTRALPGVVDGRANAHARKCNIEQSDKPYCEVVDFTASGISQRHKLVSPMDILGGEEDERIKGIANSLAAIRQSSDIGDLLAEARAQAAREDAEDAERRVLARDAEEAARRKLIVASSSSSRSQDVDPFGTRSVIPEASDATVDASSIQMWMKKALDNQGVKWREMQPGEAVAIALEIKRRREQKVWTHKQEKHIRRVYSKREIDAVYDAAKGGVPSGDAGRMMGGIAQRFGWGGRRKVS